MDILAIADSVGRRRQFIGYQVRDDKLANRIWELAEPHMDNIFEDLSRRLADSPEAPEFGAGLSMRLRAVFVEHWRRMLTQAGDEDYASAVRRAGLALHRGNTEPRWFIGAYTIIANAFIALLEAELEPDDHPLSEYIAALNRLIAVDMDLALEAYTSHVIE